MTLVKIALRNLIRYFKNNILIGIIIILSIMFSVLFTFFYKGLTVNLLGKIREMITGDYYITTPLGSDHPDIFSRNYDFFYVPEKIINHLNSLEPVESLKKRIDFYGQLSTDKESIITHFHAFDPENENKLMDNFIILKGSNLSSNYDKSELLVSEDLSEDYDMNAGDIVTVLARTERGLLREGEFIITGIFNSRLISAYLEHYIYLRNKDVDELLELDGKISRLNIHLKKEQINFNNFLDFFYSNTKEMEISHWKRGTGTFIAINVVFIFTYFSFIIITAILMISSISISIIISISERTKELSILSSLGGTKRKISTIIVLEYIFLSIICSLIGFLLALVLFFIVSRTGVFIPDKNIAFMAGGKIFYPAWDNNVFLTGILWPNIITIISAFITSFREINIRSLNN